MIGNLKALSLALCTVFMFGALSVSASAETTDVITSPVQDTYVTGSQLFGTNVFSTKWTPTAKIECTTATYTGTFSGTSTSVMSVTPAFTGCKAAGLNATVDDENCKFVLTGTTADAYPHTDGQVAGQDATVSLNCGDQGALKITAPLGCTITLKDTHPANIKVNQNLLGVTYDNEFDGVTWDVKATITLDGIFYTSTGACQTLGITATDSDGFLTQNVTIKGYEDVAHTNKVNLTVS